MSRSVPLICRRRSEAETICLLMIVTAGSPLAAFGKMQARPPSPGRALNGLHAADHRCHEHRYNRHEAPALEPGLGSGAKQQPPGISRRHRPLEQMLKRQLELLCAPVLLITYHLGGQDINARFALLGHA